jgi:hypothetical protein
MAIPKPRLSVATYRNVCSVHNFCLREQWVTTQQWLDSNKEHFVLAVTLCEIEVCKCQHWFGSLLRGRERALGHLENPTRGVNRGTR